jgi:hypothetical protein
MKNTGIWRDSLDGKRKALTGRKETNMAFERKSNSGALFKNR